MPLTSKEESLDRTNWEELRCIGRKMVDDMLTYLENVRDRPAWQPVPASATEAISGTLRTGHFT